jgi:Zinc finger C-x8-C-x5-C-x3-H type (and similar)
VNEKKEKKYSEELLVLIMLGIIDSNPEPILMHELGQSLQDLLNEDNLVQYFTDNFGGFEQFLRKHGDKFLISGIAPRSMVLRKEQNTQEHHPASGDEQDEQQAHQVHLDPLTEKQYMLITRYKTIPCQAFTIVHQCPHGNSCNFSHGDNQRRRNPLSPFFVSYSGRLPSLQETMEFLNLATSHDALEFLAQKDPNLLPENLHTLSEEKINELLLGKITNDKDFPHSRILMEVEYSLENYRTSPCPTRASGKRCSVSVCCPHAHSERELRFGNEKNNYFSKLVKNNLPYMFQQGKWQEALNFIDLLEIQTKIAFLKKYEILFLITFMPEEFPHAFLPWELQIQIAQSSVKLELAVHGHVSGITTCNKIFNELHPFSQATMLCYPAKHGNVVVLARLLQLIASVRGEADLIKLVNHGSCMGQTALHWAVACGRDDRRNKTEYRGGDWKNTVNLLVAFGAEISLNDYERHDAFYFARKSYSQSQEKEEYLRTLKEGLTRDPINFRKEFKASVFQTIMEKYNVDLNQHLHDLIIINGSVSSSIPSTASSSIASLIATQGIYGGRQGPSPQLPPPPPDQSQPPEKPGDGDGFRLN